MNNSHPLAKIDKATDYNIDMIISLGYRIKLKLVQIFIGMGKGFAIVGIHADRIFILICCFII